MDTESQAADAPTEERKDDTRSPKAIASFWQVQLALADALEKDWRKTGEMVLERYRRERSGLSKAIRTHSKRFNILYSNTETTKAALYGKAAKPDVRRRFGEADPNAREAAIIIERALEYCAEDYDVDKPIQAALHEYLLPGRGVMRLVYEAEVIQVPMMNPYTQAPIVGLDNSPLMQEMIGAQTLKIKHVYWQDFRMSPARCWDDVWWVAYRHTMSREDMRRMGFEAADRVPLNWAPSLGSKREIPEALKKAEVWEIWDKFRQERVWIVNGFDEPLLVEKDPLGLSTFFPQAEPLKSIDSTDDMVPTPEFVIYQDQADALDEIVTRIDRLTKALKRRGVYNKAIEELARLQNAGDNTFIGVENWAVLQNQGGLEKAFESEDISLIAVVLKELYVQRDMLVQAIWEVIGIADIMRGQSDPSETLGAQELKANFGSNRLKRRQRAVQKWIRDTYKLKAEILAEHFEQNTLSEMTGKQVTPEVMQILRSDKLRAYKIDIETDSTIFEDANRQKQAVLELITSITQYLQAAVPTVQQEPLLAPLIFELLEIGVRSVKEGRAVEEVIEQTKQAIFQKIQQQMSQPPEPTADDKAKLAKVENDRAKIEADKEEKDRRFVLDAGTKAVEIAHNARALDQGDAAHQMAQDGQTIDALDRYGQHLNTRDQMAQDGQQR